IHERQRLQDSATDDGGRQRPTRDSLAGTDHLAGAFDAASTRNRTSARAELAKLPPTTQAGGSTVPAYVSELGAKRTRARHRRRRERFTFFVSLGVILAAVMTTVYVARTRAIPFQFSLQAASAPAAKSFDHFDFSYYWLATHGQPNLAIHGQAAFLVDLDARQVLWQRDAETSRAPASLTKMITAMVAIDDAGSLTRMVEITTQATRVIPSVMGLTPGESVSLQDLLYGLFLDSGDRDAQGLPPAQPEPAPVELSGRDGAQDGTDRQRRRMHRGHGDARQPPPDRGGAQRNLAFRRRRDDTAELRIQRPAGTCL